MRKQWMYLGVVTMLLSAGIPGESCVVLAANASAGGKVLISDVIIAGNRRMSTEQIKVRLRTQAGKEYNPAAVDEDVRDLYKTNQFSNIITYVQDDGPGRAKVYFTFRDLPNVVQKVTFLGAKHVKEEELRKITGVQLGMSLNPSINQEGCRKILDMYEEMGRVFSSCQLLKGGDPNDTEVIYQITEGPKVKVRDIQFIGSTFVSGPRLATRIKSSSQWFHLIGGTFIAANVESDIKELVKYFRNAGYQDVKVELEKQRSADGAEITLIFHIQEGERTRVKEVEKTSSNQTILVEQLDGAIHCQSDQVIEARSNLGVTFEENQPARIGSIKLVGNVQVSDESILAHVPLFPGQVLSYPKLRQIEKNLAQLGVFVVDPAKGIRPTITVINQDDSSAFKDLVITVKEKAK